MEADTERSRSAGVVLLWSSAWQEILWFGRPPLVWSSSSGLVVLLWFGRPLVVHVCVLSQSKTSWSAADAFGLIVDTS